LIQKNFETSFKVYATIKPRRYVAKYISTVQILIHDMSDPRLDSSTPIAEHPTLDYCCQGYSEQP
jgi:hypothetical protein